MNTSKLMTNVISKAATQLKMNVPAQLDVNKIIASDMVAVKAPVVALQPNPVRKDDPTLVVTPPAPAKTAQPITRATTEIRPIRKDDPTVSINPVPPSDSQTKTKVDIKPENKSLVLDANGNKFYLDQPKQVEKTEEQAKLPTLISLLTTPVEVAEVVKVNNEKPIVSNNQSDVVVKQPAKSPINTTTNAKVDDAKSGVSAWKMALGALTVLGIGYAIFKPTDSKQLKGQPAKKSPAKKIKQKTI